MGSVKEDIVVVAVDTVEAIAREIAKEDTKEDIVETVTTATHVIAVTAATAVTHVVAPVNSLQEEASAVAHVKANNNLQKAVALPTNGTVNNAYYYYVTMRDKLSNTSTLH